MKLRNKVTGEIAEVEGGVFKLKIGALEQHLQSLERLIDEWEDYEESGYTYWIDTREERIVQADLPLTDNCLEYVRELGLSFESKDEADKAVEKLKAWKRLKDKGFHISGWDNSIGDDYYKPSQIVIELNGNPDWDEYDNINDIKEELDLLFGGK